jgi:hypothetical protein
MPEPHIDLKVHPYRVIGRRLGLTLVGGKELVYSEQDASFAFCSNLASAEFLAKQRRGKVELLKKEVA